MLLISESSYTLYIAFMGILLALIAQLHGSLAGSLKWLRIAATSLVINFGTGWWILLQTSAHHQHRPLIHVIFYGTMILGPLFLLSVLLLDPLVGIKNMLIGVYKRLRGQTNTAQDPQLQAILVECPINNTLSSLSSTETHESDNETGSSRVTSSVPRSGSNSSIGGHVEADNIQVTGSSHASTSSVRRSGSNSSIGIHVEAGNIQVICTEVGS